MKSAKPASRRGRCSALAAENKKLRFELLMVSKLAAETAQFYNPLHAGHAKTIRDRVLANPDDYV